LSYRSWISYILEDLRCLHSIQTVTSRTQITADVVGRGRRMVIGGYSDRNYQIMDEESNGGMVIPLGMTS
jgi:hypothetical protein